MAMEACGVAPTSLFIIFFIIFSVFIGFSNADRGKGLYVFGDSLVDVGNNNYLHTTLARANFPPYGIDFPTKQPTGRFSNGKNVADFLAESLNVSYPPPYLSLVSKANKEKDTLVDGVNFASGGAGIYIDNDVKYMQAVHLTEQKHHFTQVCRQLDQQCLGPNGTKAHLNEAWTMIFIGNNDIIGYIKSPIAQKKYKPDQFVDAMFTSFEKHLQKLYSLGSQLFRILGPLPIGCLLELRSSTGHCNELGNYMSAKFNELFKPMPEKLEELMDIRISYRNAHSALLSMMQKSSRDGFKETKATCCGSKDLKAKVPCIPGSYICPNRKDHIFWDLTHPTEEVHRLLA